MGLIRLKQKNYKEAREHLTEAKSLLILAKGNYLRQIEETEAALAALEMANSSN